jgi:hypothetical protein
MPILIQFMTIIDESGLKSHFTPKSPKGDFFKLLIFSCSPLGARGENNKNQQFEGFLDQTH